MIPRPQYTDALRKSIGIPLIKIITGIRRCGKSSLLILLEESLIAGGVEPSRILKVNMESLEFDYLREYGAMYRFVKERLPEGGFFLLDEAQEVSGWERLVASFLAEGKVECFVTGSNASLLTSELGILLTGRYLKFSVLPLTFKEYLVFQAARSIGPNGTESSPQDRRSLLASYLRFGGFPAIQFLGDDDSIAAYLSTLLDSILFRDVVKRHTIRDPEALRRILAFAFDNVGNITSSRRISEYFKSQRRTVSIDTVANYLGYLCDAFALHKVSRFDIKGKQRLEFSEKYYAGDLGLRNALLGYRSSDISGLIENVVFLELLRRGNTVSIGIVGGLEVDFVAEKSGQRAYFQVCVSMDDSSTMEREFGSLKRIDDHWPKTVITYTPTPLSGKLGIQVITLHDFLME
ncbi:MAG: ATP-binding protein [Spirochaetes bacterium]|nr:ATP-binding protein [Spirochaetota bacterium]